MAYGITSPDSHGDSTPNRDFEVAPRRQADLQRRTGVGDRLVVDRLAAPVVDLLLGALQYADDRDDPAPAFHLARDHAHGLEVDRLRRARGEQPSRRQVARVARAQLQWRQLEV